ncbi:uncharacterized protein SCHCODRAFT_02523433 [Schizophyllum commune H4-8]|nr:uncharacterized protein SCHCODRAFT_02523433 [Schizophyllum commune H4-8]KAI5899226.1 hypothetical protein SCHCODRAFT_02523433 [Schizophyllum commune H4-8]
MGRFRSSCQHVSSVLKSALQVLPSSATHAAASSDPEHHILRQRSRRVRAILPRARVSCLRQPGRIFPPLDHEMSAKRGFARSFSHYLPNPLACHDTPLLLCITRLIAAFHILRPSSSSDSRLSLLKASTRSSNVSTRVSIRRAGSRGVLAHPTDS